MTQLLGGLVHGQTEAAARLQRILQSQGHIITQPALAQNLIVIRANHLVTTARYPPASA